MAELGVIVGQGVIHFSPVLLSERELRSEPGVLDYLDVAGELCRLQVPVSAAALTVCRVPTRGARVLS